MIVTGKRVCFNCEAPSPLRKLEAREPAKNKKKKGKLIREAYVCENCFKSGNNKIPYDGFTGRIVYTPPPQLPKKMTDFLKQQKEAAEKKLALV